MWQRRFCKGQSCIEWFVWTLGELRHTEVNWGGGGTKVSSHSLPWGSFHASFTFLLPDFSSVVTQGSQFVSTPSNSFKCLKWWKGGFQSQTYKAEMVLFFLTTSSPYPATELNPSQNNWQLTHPVISLCGLSVTHTFTFNINVIYIKYRRETSISPRGPGYRWSIFETPWNHFAKFPLVCFPILNPFHPQYETPTISVTKQQHLHIQTICEHYFDDSQPTNEKTEKFG